MARATLWLPVGLPVAHDRAAAMRGEIGGCGSMPRPVLPKGVLASRSADLASRWHGACTASSVHFSANEFVASPKLGPKFQLGAFQLLAESRCASERVGGDFYAFEQRDAKRLIVVVGDACGRGSEAAKLLPGVLTRLEDLSHSAIGRPSLLLEELNRRVIDEMPSDRFVTGAIYEFDAEAGTLTVANAGHVPAILRSARGNVNVIGEASGPPLGVFGNCKYVDQRYRIRKDDVVVFMTDGIVEVVETDLAKMPTLRALIADAPPGSPGVHHFLMANVEDQARDRRADDMTLLSLEVLSAGAATPSIDLERVV